MVGSHVENLMTEAPQPDSQFLTKMGGAITLGRMHTEQEDSQ